MPEWRELIRQRLGSLNLPAAMRDEVIQELAAHLEDVYEQKLADGSDPSRAMELALGEVGHWRPLARGIERSKQESIMNNRSRQFWLPALISLSGSMIWMMALQIIDAKLRMPWKHSGLAYIPYVIWVATLPLIGTACGYLSFRAGSQRAARLTAAVFPSIVMAILWLVLLVVVLLRRAPYPFQALNFVYGFALWVIVPAVALGLGALALPLINRTDAQGRASA
jgi:hypothetical protein